MKKRIIAFVVAMTFVMALIPTTAVYATSQVNVTINGQQVIFPDASPAIVDGRTLVPIRAVFEALGFVVGWNNDTRTATMARDSDTIVIAIGSAIFTTNGIAHTLDVPAQIIDGSTMVPIRLPLESVGYDLDWDDATRTVLISSGAFVFDDLWEMDIWYNKDDLDLDDWNSWGDWDNWGGFTDEDDLKE
jgi:hypothetical protein